MIIRKNTFLIFCLAIFGMLTITSCGDGESPVITITSPSDGDTFSTGDIIDLKGTVTDDVEVTEITVEVEGLFAESQVGLPEAGSAFTLDDIDFEITNVTSSGSSKLWVRATDNDGNQESESVDINIEM